MIFFWPTINGVASDNVAAAAPTKLNTGIILEHRKQHANPKQVVVVVVDSGSPPITPRLSLLLAGTHRWSPRGKWGGFGKTLAVKCGLGNPHANGGKNPGFGLLANAPQCTTRGPQSWHTFEQV